ncbi:hypothetical protein GOBAR_AA25073 [Gossypium barbadense]|uniref:Xyloglucan endotransglucosylase/hydrolase n=1 Tax=Gossypium barbadense TaxID=3634 RepID=A0A2P5WWX6_GOSBA|nr:hypothetical protein GOBAR_AA25073 [Gossypium barbadense]
MPLFLSLLLILWFPSTNADWPPSLGYWPSSKLRPMSFYSGFRNLWGPNHQSVDQSSLTIWLDRTSESGFKSIRPFHSGYFGASIKLQFGYTAGLSNNEVHPGFHDEVDMEFLGTTFGTSSWADEDGKYKADYRYQPFVAKYTNFKAGGCSAYAPAWCCPVSASPFQEGGLTMQQYRAMRWVQRYHMVYDYCRDPKRNHALTPECWS